ncbi:MAG: hypothetical protein ACLR6I_07550 [Waltera sp.]
MEVEGPADKLYYRVARGRYLWDPATEDFTLFVTSLHHVTKELLEQTEEKSGTQKAESVATGDNRRMEHRGRPFSDPVKAVLSSVRPVYRPGADP